MSAARANAPLTIGVIAAIASASATMTRRAYSKSNSTVFGLPAAATGAAPVRRSWAALCSFNAISCGRTQISCVSQLHLAAAVVVAQQRPLLAAHIGRGVD